MHCLVRIACTYGLHMLLGNVFCWYPFYDGCFMFDNLQTAVLFSPGTAVSDVQNWNCSWAYNTNGHFVPWMWSENRVRISVLPYTIYPQQSLFPWYFMHMYVKVLQLQELQLCHCWCKTNSLWCILQNSHHTGCTYFDDNIFVSNRGGAKVIVLHLHK